MEESNVIPLLALSMRKLSFMCSTDKEFAAFFNDFLSRSQFGRSFVCKEFENQMGFKLKFGYYYCIINKSHASKNSKFSPMTVKPDDLQALKMRNSTIKISDDASKHSKFYPMRVKPDVRQAMLPKNATIEISDDGTFYRSYTKTNYLNEKCSYFFCEKMGLTEYIWRSDYKVLMSYKLESLVTLLLYRNIASSLDIRKKNPSEESAEAKISLTGGDEESKGDIIASRDDIAGSFDVRKYYFEESAEANLPLTEGGIENEDEIILSDCRVASQNDIAGSLDIRKDYFEESASADISLADGDKESERKIISSLGDIVGSLDIRKDYNEESVVSYLPLREDKEQKSEIMPTDFTIVSCSCDFCRFASDNYFPSYLEVQKISFSEKSDEVSLILKDKSGELKQISASDFAITSYDCMHTDLSSECISSSMDAQKDKFPKESEGDFPFRKENSQHESTLTATDILSSMDMPSKCISSNLGIQKDIYDAAIESVDGDECSRAILSTSTEDCNEDRNRLSEKIDWINQFLYIEQYAKAKNLVQEETLPETKDSKQDKFHSDDSTLSSIIFEETKLFKYKESFQDNNPSAEEIYLQSEESELTDEKSELQEHAQPIQNEKEENEFLKSEIKTNFVEDTKKYDTLGDDCLLEILSSVFDYICEIEENTSLCTEKQEFISESRLKCKDTYSKPYCVKSVQILLHFLDNIKTDLKSKAEDANLQKLYSEAQVIALESYDLENVKEGKELQETAKSIVRSYDKVCANIEEDRALCELYYKNLETILNFFQENCCFNGNLAI